MRWLLAATLVLSASSALSFDHGEYGNVPANVRAWFKSVRNGAGIPCCDIADGHATTWKADPKTGSYQVDIDGAWVPVPPEVVIHNAGNPTGESIVWYYRNGGDTVIRCFVPGGGT